MQKNISNYVYNRGQTSKLRFHCVSKKDDDMNTSQSGFIFAAQIQSGCHPNLYGVPRKLSLEVPAAAAGF